MRSTRFFLRSSSLTLYIPSVYMMCCMLCTSNTIRLKQHFKMKISASYLSSMTYHTKFKQEETYSICCPCCSVAKSCLEPQEVQHARLLCPLLSFRVCSNPCLFSEWYCLTMSSSVIAFSFCLQSFPAPEFFTMSQFLASSWQSIEASASASVWMNIQSWFPLVLTVLISLLFKGLPRVFFNHSSKALSLLYGLTLTSIHDNLKIHSLDYTGLYQQSDVSAF